MSGLQSRLHHTWDLLTRPNKPSLAALTEALLTDWAADPHAVDIEGLLGELRLQHRDDPDAPKLADQLGHLVWWEKAKLAGTHLALESNQRSALGTAFEFGIVLVSTGADHPHLQEASLTDLHEAWVLRESGDDPTRAATLRERLVLLLVVEGHGALSPDLYVIARRLAGENGESPPPIGVIPVRLHHALERAERGETRKDVALGRELEGLAGLVAAAGSEHWRERFQPFDRKRYTDRFRTELRVVLETTMGLLEQTTGKQAADVTQLAELREAASILVFRVFFVVAMERRNLLYDKPPRAGESLRGLVAAGEDAKDSPFLYLQDLTAAIRSGKSVTGRKKKPSVAIKHASIFNNRPTADFSTGLAAWLDGLDAATAKLAKTRARLVEWDRLIERLEPLAQGQIIRYEFEAQEATPIGGGNEHVQRVLGDVYEQILAMIPVRAGKGKTSKVQLTLNGKPRASKDVAEPTSAKELKSLDKAAQSERKALGAHYTPEALVTEVVLAALEPVFAAAWARAGKRPDAYARELLGLRVLDPAMGSAHFLTVTALEIARELAWVEVYGKPRDPEWFEVWPESYDDDIQHEPDPWSWVEPGDREELDRIAARHLAEVAEACCYGVDVKPLAVELGKLALWMLTMIERQSRGVADDTPPPALTFLDKNLRCGDSLRGVDEAGVRRFFEKVYGLSRPRQGELFRDRFHDLSDALRCLFRLHDTLSKSTDVVVSEGVKLLAEAEGYLRSKKSTASSDPQELRVQLHWCLREFEHALRWTWDLAFLYDWHGRNVSALIEVIAKEGTSATDLAGLLGGIELPGTGKTTKKKESKEATYRERVRALAMDLRAFHWPLEFYDVFHRETAGFDCIVTNPPFLGDRDLRKQFGEIGVTYLRTRHTSGATVDLTGFFVLGFDALVNTRGSIGAVAPNTLAQGKNRRGVFVPLVAGPSSKFEIFRSCASRVWPGDANVHILTAHLRRPGSSPMASTRRVVESRDAAGVFQGMVVIPTEQAPSSYLDDGPESDGVLIPGQDVPIVYVGMFPRGEFDRTSDFLQTVPRKERSVVFAYLNNRDVQQQPDPVCQRVIIDVSVALDAAGVSDGTAPEQETWLKKNMPFMYKELVSTTKSERTALPNSLRNKKAKSFWWLFEETRPGLRAAWEGLDTFVAIGAVGKVFAPTVLRRVDAGLGLSIVPTHQIFVVPSDSRAVFALLSSLVFETFTRRACSSLKSDLRFTPSEVFPYFPFPWPTTPFDDNPHRAPVLNVPKLVEHRLNPPAQRLLDLRKDILLHPERHELTRARVGGPTDLYNLFDDPTCELPSIQRFRTAHHELEQAILREYGWDDLHGPWTFERPWIDGTWRHVPPAATRREYLRRLADLNHQRAKEG